MMLVHNDVSIRHQRVTRRKSTEKDHYAKSLCKPPNSLSQLGDPYHTQNPKIQVIGHLLKWGYPKSSIDKYACSIINHLLWGTLIYGNPYIYICVYIYRHVYIYIGVSHQPFDDLQSQVSGYRSLAMKTGDNHFLMRGTWEFYGDVFLDLDGITLDFI